MKNLNSTQQIVISEENSSAGLLEFNEVLIYNEMADQTSVRLNLVDQIHSQLNQLDMMISRKQFVLKEIAHEVVK